MSLNELKEQLVIVKVKDRKKIENLQRKRGEKAVRDIRREE